MHIIGDVEGRDCVIVDDIIDTAGTICHAANALRKKGARSVTVYGTHPVLSSGAIENIEKSEIAEVVVTDTIPLSQEAANCKKLGS
jgi:Phosphoribosylpyrophosphate synthetase